MEFRNSTFFRVVYYVSLPMLLILSLFLMYHFALFVYRHDYSQTPMLIVGLLALYLFCVCIKYWKFVNATIAIGEEGFTISSGQHKKYFAWNDGPYLIKESSLWQLFEVYDANHRLILMVDHMMPGFELFQKLMREYIPDQPNAKHSPA